MDYKKLAADLLSGCEENCADCEYAGDSEFECTIAQLAATAITALLARAEAAEERAEKAERERDAAVDQLRGDCEKCVNFRVTWNGCTPDFECPISDRCLNRDMWEWNGGKKEE